jgi:hypothetical protein
MILSGEKKEEYREIKSYWMKRLMSCYNRDFLACKHLWCFYYIGHTHCPKAPKLCYDSVLFINGYSSTSPRVKMELKSISTGIGNPKHGAPSDTPVFILKLGKTIKEVSHEQA